MCRLFGFRSVIKSGVHQSLTLAKNSLNCQGQAHPDGWGIAYYAEGVPHLIKSEKSVFHDEIFSDLSGIVTSETVLAHIRRATKGKICLTNTHPFQYGSWVFAHNGNINNFATLRPTIEAKLDPQLKRYILGNTDSELIFYFILTVIKRHFSLSDNQIRIETLAPIIRLAIDELISIVGPYSQHDNAGPEATYLTFILTNGQIMLAHQGGKNLLFSTYKTDCVEKDSCQHFTSACISACQDGYINHLLFSSEETKGPAVWFPLLRGEIVGADSAMKLYRLAPAKQ